MNKMFCKKTTAIPGYGFSQVVQGQEVHLRRGRVGQVERGGGHQHRDAVPICVIPERQRSGMEKSSGKKK